MSKTFHTNPGDKPKVKRRRPKFRKSKAAEEKAYKYFDYREAVAREITNLGVHFRSAEVAVLDYSSKVHEGLVNGLTPNQTAVTMIDEVRRIYVHKNYRVVSSVVESGDL